MNINDTDLGGFTPSQQQAIRDITPSMNALDNMNKAGCLPPLAVSYFLEILKGIEVLAVDLRDDNEELLVELAEAENDLHDADRLADMYKEQRDVLATFIKEVTGSDTIDLFALDADGQALPVATL